MEDSFRNTLIIISAIVIAAIFIHGYWTIRKQKNPYKLKTKDEPVVPESRGFVVLALIKMVLVNRK